MDLILRAPKCDSRFLVPWALKCVGISTRTWLQALEALAGTKQGANQLRWKTAAKDKAFVPLLPRVIIETPGELILKVLETGTVSTNVFLRCLHNFCVDMNWLPWPLIPKRQWPDVRFKEKRAITLEEHQKIVATDSNPTFKFPRFELLLF